jgi:hypothetical protein
MMMLDRGYAYFNSRLRVSPISPIVDAEQARKNQAAIDLLDSWLDESEDAAEHKKAWDFLKTALDEDRLSENDATDVIVATTNVAHLSRFITALEWQSIE